MQRGATDRLYSDMYMRQCKGARRGKERGCGREERRRKLEGELGRVRVEGKCNEKRQKALKGKRKVNDEDQGRKGSRQSGKKNGRSKGSWERRGRGGTMLRGAGLRKKGEEKTRERERE